MRNTCSMVVQTDEVSSDDEEDLELWDRVLPKLPNIQEQVCERLQRQNEQKFVQDMLSTFHFLPPQEQAPIGPRPERINKEIQSWVSALKKERRHISVFAKETQRDVLEKSYLPSRFTYHPPSSAKPRIKCRRETHSVELDRFLKLSQSEFNKMPQELYKSMQKAIAKPEDVKVEDKEDILLQRPSQLIKLADSDAGAEDDELRDARKKVLSKLSRNCAYWVVNTSTPSEHRLQLRDTLQQVQGEYSDLEKLICGDTQPLEEKPQMTGVEKFYSLLRPKSKRREEHPELDL